MRIRLGRLGDMLNEVRGELPRVGTAGSRSAMLHGEDKTQSEPGSQSPSDWRKIFLLRWVGPVGALLIGLGGLGAGALPVVGNPFGELPFGQLMGRMLVSSSAMVFIGVGLIGLAWLLLAVMAGTPLLFHRLSAHPPQHLLKPAQVWSIFFSWTLPILVTALLFTQDIYSSIANGSIVVQGMDPYSAGPVQLFAAAD